MDIVNLLEPLIIACLIIGAMMPYAFSARTMTSVGYAAHNMCKEVIKQVEDKKAHGTPLDPNRCIAISTNASLKEMIIPGIMVIATPLVFGTLFGPIAVAGYLAGVISSGVQMAISSANSGGAWDNAKKYIEAKKLEITPTDEEKAEILAGRAQPRYYEKHSLPHAAAVCGDTVGDPLKDTSGPSLNILIKLSAIVSLIFGTFFADHHLL